MVLSKATFAVFGRLANPRIDVGQKLSCAGKVRYLGICSGCFTNNRRSEDHRGTPEAPGRVVTLIERDFWEKLTDPHPSGSEKVWGTAYRIKEDKVAEVQDYLDIHE